MRIFLIFILLLQLTLPQAQASQGLCSGLLERSTISEIESNAQRIEQILESSSPQQLEQAEKQATELIEFEKDGREPAWFKNSKRHSKIALIFTTYFVSTMLFNDIVIAHARDMGFVNFFSTHTSNFVVGIPAVGASHHFAAAGWAVAHGVRSKINLVERFKSAVARARGKMYQTKKFVSTDGMKRYGHRAFVFAGLAFTFMNLLIEWPMIKPTLDGTDVLMGEAAIIAYYYLAKKIDQRYPLHRLQ